MHLVPGGKWSDEARKAATGERLEALLAKLKEPYDCVVMHGHALLTAAESVEVARRCEVVLVCARYRETTTPLLKRAAERVAAMEIPYSGVVYVGATEQEVAVLRWELATPRSRATEAVREAPLPGDGLRIGSRNTMLKPDARRSSR